MTAWKRLAAAVLAGVALAGCEKKTSVPGPSGGGKVATGNPAIAAKFLADGEEALRKGDGQAAIEDFHAAIQSDPTSFPAWYRFQEAMRIGHREKEIREELARRLADSPDDPLWLTLSAVTDSDHREAEEHLRKAIQKAPGFPWAQFVLSEVLVTLKRYDDAVSAADRALQMEPKNCLFRLCKANALLWDEKLEDALAEVEKAKDALPGDERVPVLRAQILMVLDRVDDAILAMQEAGRLAPGAQGPRILLRDWRMQAAKSALKEYDEAFKARHLGSAADAAQKAAGYLEAVVADSADEAAAVRMLPQAEAAAAAATLQRATDALRDGKEEDACNLADRAQPWLEKARSRKLDDEAREFVALGLMKLGLTYLSIGEKMKDRGSADAKGRFKQAYEAFLACSATDPSNKSAAGLAEDAKKAMEK